MRASDNVQVTHLFDRGFAELEGLEGLCIRTNQRTKGRLCVGARPSSDAPFEPDLSDDDPQQKKKGAGRGFPKVRKIAIEMPLSRQGGLGSPSVEVGKGRWLVGVLPEPLRACCGYAARTRAAVKRGRHQMPARVAHGEL